MAYIVAAGESRTPSCANALPFLCLFLVLFQFFSFAFLPLLFLSFVTFPSPFLSFTFSSFPLLSLSLSFPISSLPVELQFPWRVLFRNPEVRSLVSWAQWTLIGLRQSVNTE